MSIFNDRGNSNLTNGFNLGEDGRSMKKIITAILALLLCGMAFAEAAEDPVCVRVGDFSYPLSQVQASLDSVMKLTEAMSEEQMTPEERARMADDIIDKFVGIGLIEARLAEAGQHDFTTAEEEQMNAAARNQYEQLWQGVYQMLIRNDNDVTEAQVTEAMAEEGYTLDSLYQDLVTAERERRAIALYVPEVPLTEADLDAYYETRFLAPDRERYGSDIARYEREILASNNEAFYTPEGYRYIRQILLKYPETATEALKPALRRVEHAGNAAAQAYAALAEAAARAEDWSELDAPRADYDAAAKALEEASRDYADERRTVTLPMLRDTLDEIDRCLDAGLSFRAMIEKFSADRSEQNLKGDGYPFHPESQGWPAEFAAAAAALEKPGDVSAPVFTEEGVHILCYDSDISAGEHVLTGEEREALKASALYDRQEQALTALFGDWKKEYHIETHPELLAY